MWEQLEGVTYNCFLMVPFPSGSRTLKAPVITSSGSAPGGGQRAHEAEGLLKGQSLKGLGRGIWGFGPRTLHSPLSFSPNMVRKTVKLMGPLASFIMSSSSSFFTLRRPGTGWGKHGVEWGLGARE